MIQTLTVITVAVAAWALAAARLERWRLGASVVMVLVGLASGLFSDRPVGSALSSEIAQRVAELILALLLFVDATSVRGGRLFGDAPGRASRVLLLALPLSLAAAVLLGVLLLPWLPWPALLVLACVVVPIDFAPADRLVRDPDVPPRVRSVLNVESGYNDGIVSPIFLFALVLASDRNDDDTPLEALGTALPFALKALAVGVVLGTLLAALMHLAARAAWMTDQSRRIVVAAAPLLTYAVTVGIEGNGFVAAFVCGIALRYAHGWFSVRRLRRAPHRDHGGPTLAVADFALLRDATTVATHTMWIAFGAVLVLIFSAGVSWPLLLFCVAALTVVRFGPVLLALVGSRFPARERVLVAGLGPRGTTSIVFGLLAYNGLPAGPIADTVLAGTVYCVLGSVILHGVVATRLVGRLAGTEDRAARSAAA